MHGWAAIKDVAFFKEFGNNSHVDASLNACQEDSKCDIPTGIFQSVRQCLLFEFFLLLVVVAGFGYWQKVYSMEYRLEFWVVQCVDFVQGGGGDNQNVMFESSKANKHMQLVQDNYKIHTIMHTVVHHVIS